MIKNLDKLEQDWYQDSCDIKDMQHKTVKAIQRDGDECIWFLTTDNYVYKMHHAQECCESVEIEDICGDLEDLIDTPIIIAEERTQDNGWSNGHSSSTWTFYELQTLKGGVTIRWYGESNGYYSETVNMCYYSPEDVLKAGVS